MGVKRGCYTVIKSELLKSSTFDVCRGFSVYFKLVAQSHTYRDSPQNQQLLHGVHGYAERETAAMGWSRHQNVIQTPPSTCSIWTAHSRRAPAWSTKEALVWSSESHSEEMSHFVWPTGGLGNGQDYVARCLSGWSFSIHDRPQLGRRRPSCIRRHEISKATQVVHAVPHATKFVLLTLVFEVISEVTEHSSTASSSDRRTTSSK